MDATEVTLRELVNNLHEVLMASHVGLYPDHYPVGTQMKSEVITRESEAFTEDNPREWDSSTIEWAADDITLALNAVEEIKGKLEERAPPRRDT